MILAVYYIFEFQQNTVVSVNMFVSAYVYVINNLKKLLQIKTNVT